jgi:MoaA/NifB/PqqE/SkfB family radical SAM enzyme
MSTWQEFYNQIRDPGWPNCEQESGFEHLPEAVRLECQNQFGYLPGSFQKQNKLINKKFPIQTATACQLKWTWSTVYLTTEKTASCHRTDHHQFNTDTFDFHNTPQKIQDRDHMLAGQWPERGCTYCRDIESAGGQSDRMTNLDFPGIHAPVELAGDPTATKVTPRMLEVYFDNTCNLKCLYCGPHFSSLWDAENKRHGNFQRGDLVISNAFVKSTNIESNKQRLFEWIKTNSQHLTVFNILGGEPLYQQELDQCLDLFEAHPAPELKLQIFTNLNARLDRVQAMVERVKRLIDCDHLREFEITASLDCWGAPQEYVRYPLDLTVWEKNFEYLVAQNWINLIINSTVTPLTVKTLPDLLNRINIWSKHRKIYHYQNSVNSPSYMFMDIFGDIFKEDFARALELKPMITPEEMASRDYLAGIAQQSTYRGANVAEIQKLYDFLNEIDRRRGTSWPETFPWLTDEFKKHNLTT